MTDQKGDLVNKRVKIHTRIHTHTSPNLRRISVLNPHPTASIHSSIPHPRHACCHPFSPAPSSPPPFTSIHIHLTQNFSYFSLFPPIFSLFSYSLPLISLSSFCIFFCTFFLSSLFFFFFLIFPFFFTLPRPPFLFTVSHLLLFLSFL